MVTELVSAHSPLCCALVALNLPDDKLTVNFHAATVVTHKTGLNTEGLETDSEQGNTEKLQTSSKRHAIAYCLYV